MLKRYNIALTPLNISAEVIKLSCYFSKIANNYILSKKSLPHVTLYQFESEEKEIENIWNKVCLAMTTHNIELIFKTFSLITFDNIIYWVSLLPDQCSELKKMHTIVAKILNLPAKKNFDPHMTLVNSKDKNYKTKIENVLNTFESMSDKFVLSIGEGDQIGQLTKLLKTTGQKVISEPFDQSYDFL